MRKKDTSPIPKNHIVELLEGRGKHANWLAEEVDTSPAHMSRLINHQARVTSEMANKIGNALGVDSNKVVDLPFSKKFVAGADEGLLGSALGWLLEAAEKEKIKLSHQDLSHWATYVHNHALQKPLNFNQTKDLAYTIIDVIRQVKG